MYVRILVKGMREIIRLFSDAFRRGDTISIDKAAHGACCNDDYIGGVLDRLDLNDIVMEIKRNKFII
jgi:hypothetical protein